MGFIVQVCIWLRGKRTEMATVNYLSNFLHFKSNISNFPRKKSHFFTESIHFSVKFPPNSVPPFNLHPWWESQKSPNKLQCLLWSRTESKFSSCPPVTTSIRLRESLAAGGFLQHSQASRWQSHCCFVFDKHRFRIPIWTVDILIEICDGIALFLLASVGIILQITTWQQTSTYFWIII